MTASARTTDLQELARLSIAARCQWSKPADTSLLLVAIRTKPDLPAPGAAVKAGCMPKALGGAVGMVVQLACMSTEPRAAYPAENA